MVTTVMKRRAGLVVLVIGVVGMAGGCALLTALVGGAPATVPDFAGAVFTNPSVISHPYFPQVVGTTRTYTSETEDGTETIVVEVLDETRLVARILCRVVRDRVSLDGLLIEDTHDWYAQDDDGNVWYMGEEVDNYNYDDDDVLIDIDHEGAWEAEADVADIGVLASPGYLMLASSAVGDAYHQEYYRGEAEDMGEVVAVGVSVTLSDGTTYDDCVKTLDTTPLEPDVEEHKYYARDVGVVLEEDLESGERVELVSVTNG